MVKQPKGILRTGTSGIAVPGNKETRPVEFQLVSRLNYYSSLFNTLEVNSTFYKLPRPSTFEKWVVDVPETFQFTIKLWKEITHAKKLNFDLENINVFFKAVEHIGEKKGCLLIQFPGSITIEYFSRVEKILERLGQLDAENNWRKAIEFRSETWYIRETDELLDEYSASMVLHDMPKSKNLALNGDAPFAYFRFHGTKGDYRGSYSKDFLREQSDKMRDCLDDGKDVYAYFNNTMGSAFENAMTLRNMVLNSEDTEKNTRRETPG